MHGGYLVITVGLRGDNGVLTNNIPCQAHEN